MAPTFEKKDNDTYATEGLNEKQFRKAFDLIRKAQNKARRNAKRTLTPGKLNNKTNAQIKSLGEKVKGVGFTREDLLDFEKSRKRHIKKFDSSTSGITYSQIVALSREIDIKRANNQVDDGSGINQAALSSLKGNLAYVRVKASSISKHEEHRVEIRFEEWDMFMISPPGGDYVKAVKQAAKGRISFDCDCGRHQYWYRYLATIGNYAVTPPKETAYPKIRNDKLTGVACKHVLKAIEMCQSTAWHRVMAKRMEHQANMVGFGDDKRQVTYHLNKEDRKEASRNRRNKIDPQKAKQEYRKYENSQKSIRRKLKELDKENKQLKARKQREKRLDKDLKKTATALVKTFIKYGLDESTAIKQASTTSGLSAATIRNLIK